MSRFHGPWRWWGQREVLHRILSTRTQDSRTYCWRWASRLAAWYHTNECVVNQKYLWILVAVLTCNLWAAVVDRSFINDLTCRRRLTRVAIRRGSTPWPTSDGGGSGMRSSPFLELALVHALSIYSKHTSSSSTGSTVVKSMLYSWMILGYKELKSMTRMYLSHKPRFGSKTRPPLYLSRFPFTFFAPPSSPSWGSSLRTTFLP